MDAIHYSSKSSEWETPRSLFDILNNQYNFSLDPCCTEVNRLCEKFYTKEKNGLAQSWAGERVFMNPPYGRGISAWVQKAFEESLHPHTSVVALVPARTDTKWFHLWCANAPVLFISGRLSFINKTLPSYTEDGSFKKSPACFPSMLCFFNCAPGGDCLMLGTLASFSCESL